MAAIAVASRDLNRGPRGGTLPLEEERLPDVESLYRLHFPLLREKCRRMLGDAAEAEDLAQETLVRLWRAGRAAGDARTVTAWIYRTSTRLAIDRIRERARKRGPADGDRALEALPARESGADEALEERQKLEQLARVMPAGELEIALLHRLDGLTQPEIAEVLEISERTVRRSLARFDERLAALRQEMIR